MFVAIILIATNILHPRGADFDDTAEHLQEIADAGIYLGGHLGLLVGGLLLTGGLIGISRSLAGAGGEVWARLGFAATVEGAALMLVLIAVDGIALKAVANEWVSTQNASLFQAAYVLEQIGLGLFAMLVFFIFGVVFILYGLAVALSDLYSKWLGWLALALGIAGAVIGMIQAIKGPSDTLTNVLFPIVSILLTVWILVMGVLMWRKTSAA